MRRVLHLVIVILIALAAAAPPAQAAHRQDRVHHCGVRGTGYRAALQARAAAERAARRAAARTREERFIARQTARYSDRYGRCVGRWFVLVYAYWPRAEWGRAMFCIHEESGGDPDALGDLGEIGLFQLLNYKCRP